MPIYEYRRPDGSTFEVIQSFSDDPLKVDPDSGVPVERVFHAPAVHFKGKGFYNTDYGTRSRNRETAASGEKPSSGESGSDAKTGSSSDSTAKANGSGDGGNASKPAKGEGGGAAKPASGKE
ncbi:MAG TPA: zinc ribbon domain-containing protein [Solirubrobacteraceae bacterium]|nr:zinc ribbon domain-containing protein [Solirubrobacteraceae bacterium]